MSTAALLSSAHVKKRRTTAAARAALLGGLMAITDDDYGNALYVVTLGAATFHAHSLEELEALLDHIEKEKESHV